ncbi:hypothetical protein [Streptomyces sp. 1331.2]|uniref:hypothetical protein n=1 Tax=Streptomyces sp. 1331.2 TaxID=1938835 RepID=UPI000BC4EA42|nr:hypothetical protein [Streptomyces sp. 1331.2]SOB83539.1 hypothetical protein SAMN06272789_3746 [Streptomyces sp. 1331.2]
MTANPMASRHRWIYLGSIALLVAMLVTGLLSFTQLHATDLADRKARKLSEALSSAGYPVPTQEQIVHTLGEDGGAVCADPANALTQAQWKYGMSNGAGGPGQRPVLSDREVVRGEAIVLSVYCPDKLAAIQDRIDDLDLRDTVRR